MSSSKECNHGRAATPNTEPSELTLATKMQRIWRLIRLSSRAH